MTFNGSAVGYFGSLYIATLSRGTTMVSLTVDAADDAATAMNSGPTGANFSSTGFQIVGQSNGATGNAHTGGNWTAQY